MCRPRDASLAFAEAVTSGNVDAAERCWAVDSVMEAADGMRIVGRDAIAAVVRTLVAAEARIRIDVGEEIAAGGVAHARTRMVIEIVGQPLISLAGEVVYIHEEDGWKILIDRVSSSAMV